MEYLEFSNRPVIPSCRADHRRIIKSFDLVGASAVVDSLNASQWCQNRPDDRDDYTENAD